MVMLEHSFLINRHFYSFATLRRTTLAMTMDCVYDGVTTPFAFPTAAMLLIKMAAGVHDELKRDARSSCESIVTRLDRCIVRQR